MTMGRWASAAWINYLLAAHSDLRRAAGLMWPWRTSDTGPHVNPVVGEFNPAGLAEDNFWQCCAVVCLLSSIVFLIPAVRMGVETLYLFYVTFCLCNFSMMALPLSYIRELHRKISCAFQSLYHFSPTTGIWNSIKFIVKFYICLKNEFLY